MRVNSEHQEKISKILASTKEPWSIKQITYQCDLTYHQVTSALTSLLNKGHVDRIGVGMYQLAVGASLLQFSPEDRIKMYEIANRELVNQVGMLNMRIAELLLLLAKR